MSDAPGHEQTAAGLSSHLKSNEHHERNAVMDGHEMSTEFDITTDKKGVSHAPHVHAGTASLLNALLKTNHNNHHVYFSDTGGFHNHHVHFLLAAYAIGATPEQLQSGYDAEDFRQRQRFPIDMSVVERMDNEREFLSMLSDDRHFHNYLIYFVQKIENEGWKKMTNDYLFSRTPIAEELFEYGIEFEQPGIIAEGLAGACVHSEAFGPYIFECEKLASTSSAPCKPLVELLQEIRNNSALIDKDHWQGGDSFAYNDNVTSNAPPGIAKLAAQWKVDRPEDLSYRTAEMINVNGFIAGAAQRPNKVVKIDFIFVHHINAAIFFSVFQQQDWLSDAVKIRLLEAYTRLNLLTYAAALAPELRTSEIINYKPLVPGSTWSAIMHRALSFHDDGHTVKVIRALAHAEQVSEPWQQKDGESDGPYFPMKGKMFLQVANMAIDSTETEPNTLKRWVRGAGSDAAWAEFSDRNF